MKRWIVPAVLLIATVLGMGVIISAPLHVDPLQRFLETRPVERFFGPLGVLSVALAGWWQHLPAVLFPVVTGAFVAAALFARRMTGIGRTVVTAVVLALAVYTACGSLLLFVRGEIAPGGLWPAMQTILQALGLPVALVFHWLYRVFGWAAYLVPLYTAVLAVASQLSTRRRRERLAGLASWAFGEAVLLSVTVSFMAPTRAPTLLRDYFARFIHPVVGSTVFALIALTSLAALVLRVLGVGVPNLAARRGSKRRRASRRPRETRPSGNRRERARERPQTATPPSVKAVSLDAAPVPPRALSEPDTSAAGSWARNGQAEIRWARAEADRALAAVGLDLVFESANAGPATVFLAYDLPRGTSVGAVERQEKELSFQLSDANGRVQIPVPGRKNIGFLFPRRSPEPLPFSAGAASIVTSEALLPLYLGTAVDGEHVVEDLSSFPHLLVAGTTGSGKSVFLHSLIHSLLSAPEAFRVRFVLGDPKRVEFRGYRNLAHLACPIVEEPDALVGVLEAARQLMESRYRHLSRRTSRSLAELHAAGGGKNMAYVVVVIDEVSDLFFSPRGKEIRRLVIQLAQKSRATGIHIVLATQRPSADIFDGALKANFPARVAFRTASQVDSRVILDRRGAEELFGRGDGLLVTPGREHPLRFQGALATAEGAG